MKKHKIIIVITAVLIVLVTAVSCEKNNVKETSSPSETPDIVENTVVPEPADETAGTEPSDITETASSDNKETGTPLIPDLTEGSTEIPTTSNNPPETATAVITVSPTATATAAASNTPKATAATTPKASAMTYDEFKKYTDNEYRNANKSKLSDINNHKQDVIAAVAKAFYDQSYLTHKSSGALPQALYDQYNSRRNYNAAPEDATSDKNLYIDCSAYVGSVYYYTFGTPIISGKSVSTDNINKLYSSKTPDKSRELMFYITGSELSALKTNSADAKAKIAEIKAALQPGDIINYRKTTDSGHVVMYLGNGKIIHSTGTANPKTSKNDTNPNTSIEKNSADERKFGTVTIDSWDRFFTKTVTPQSQNDGRTGTTNNYIFADNISAIAIFRPLNEKDGIMNGKNLTCGAIDHYLYPGIDVEKTSNLHYGNSCASGDEINFTVTIINNSASAMKALTVTENIPPELDFVSASDGAEYFKEQGIIGYYIDSIAAGKTVTFKFILKVKSGLPGGTVIRDNKTFVNGIKTNDLIYQIAAVSIDSAALNSAVNAVSGTKFDDGIAAVKAVYKNLSGSTFACVSGLTSAENLLNNKGKAVSCTLYGGFDVGSAEITSANKSGDYSDINTRARRVMQSYLENGDVIVTYSAYTKAYTTILYYNKALYGLKTDGTFGKLSAYSLSVGASGLLQDYLDTLTAYNSFLVFRPKLLG